MRAAVVAGLAPRTLAAYGPGLRAWRQYCELHRWPSVLAGDSPSERRDAESKVIQFALHLARSLAAPTIRVYLAAVRLHHIHQGGTHPWSDGLRLPLVLAGIRRQQQRQPPKRAAVTLELLLEWRHQLQLDRAADATLWAALVTAFFGLLRVSEFAIPAGGRFDPSRHLARRDVSFLSDRRGAVHGMEVHIKFAKAAQGGSAHPVPLAVQGGPLCPVAAMAHMLRLRPGAPSDPLFSLPAGVLTTAAFSTRLAALTQGSSARGSLLSAHSLRIGGAMALHEAGAPDSVLQGIGRCLPRLPAPFAPYTSGLGRPHVCPCVLIFLSWDPPLLSCAAPPARRCAPRP